MAKKFTRKGRKTRSAGRFGVRYGTKVRKLVADIEERMRQGYKCPECGMVAINRTDTGIWSCKKCNYTFSGGTYVPKTSVGLVAARSLKKAMESDVFDEYEYVVPEEFASETEDVTTENELIGTEGIPAEDIIPDAEASEIEETLSESEDIVSEIELNSDITENPL
ncbi:MAG: 50S ribosomal protein L37ae [Nitrospirae bacterium]|nr:50S ribosomal protein L37ae [Nitrospirota bacterium]